MGDAQSLEHGFLLAFVFADDGEIKLAAGLPFHILCRFRPVLLDFAQGILGFGHFFSIGEGPAHVAVEHAGDVAGGAV